MTEETLRWGIGMLVAGNAFFVMDAIRRGNRAHDQFLVLNEKVDALGSCSKGIIKQLAPLGDMKTDIAVLKLRVFGRHRHDDQTLESELDS